MQERTLTTAHTAPILAAVLALLTGVALVAQRGGDLSAGPRNPFEGNEQAILEGREIYNQECTICHGLDGTAGEMGPALGLPARRYGLRSAAEIFESIKGGIPGTEMPLARGLSDDDMWKVAAYIEGLRGTAVDAPLPGNVTLGEQIFWGKGECGACHMVRGQGGLIGPELTNIAGIRKPASIVDALTKTGHRVYGDGGAIPRKLEPLDTYQPVRVTTTDGRTIRGVLKNEDSFSLQILGLEESRLYMFDRADTKEIYYEETSLMPTDYDERLTPEEFRDLLAFLTRLAVPAPDVPSGRGRGN